MGNPHSSNNNLGLDVLNDDTENTEPLDLSDFAPSPRTHREKAPKQAIRDASRDAGFHDRGEPTAKPIQPRPPDKPAPTIRKSKTTEVKPSSKRAPAHEIGAMRRSRYYRTGRNTQLNIKVRPEDRDRIKDFCDRQEWVVGQALEYALDALEEKLKDDRDAFWKERIYNGVE